MAAAIQRARESKGLSQPELAQLIGVDRMTVSRWERGVYAVPRRNYFALEAILGPLPATVKDQSKRRHPGGRKSQNHKRRG